MITILRYLTAIAIGIASLLFTGCNVDLNFESVKGEGEVRTETRTVGDFNKIKASQGLRVILSNGPTGEVKVQANDNLHDIIITEVENNTLVIKCEKNIRRADAKNVMVNVATLKAIKSSSGASIRSNDEIKSAEIHIDASSGSNIDLDVYAKEVVCSSSSGSTIKISGETGRVIADSSSGSNINTSDLKSGSCDASSSSGSSIKLYCDNAITAKASSGSSIRYKGSPEKKEVKKSSGGSVSGN